MISSSVLNEVISETRRLNDGELTTAFRSFLKEGVFVGKPVPTTLERHRFVAELFNDCESSLQERIRQVIPNLLEGFEASNPRDDAQYLFQLISLSSAIRSGQAKQRLQRWIRQATFDDWTYDIFNISSELIAATAAYDADDEWIDFLLNVLPTRPSFKNTAIAAYRAVWQARGIECVLLLPDMLLVMDLQDSGSRPLGYLLRLTVDKVGTVQFCRSLKEALDGLQKRPEEMWTIVLKLDEILESELPLDFPQLTALLEHLQSMWKRAVVNWRSLPDRDRFEAFDKVLEVEEKNWEQRRITPPRVVAAFTFRGRYMLEIGEDEQYILEHAEEFFEDIKYADERFYMTTAA